MTTQCNGWITYLPCAITQSILQGAGNALPSSDQLADGTVALASKVIDSVGSQIGSFTGDKAAEWFNTEFSSFASKVNFDATADVAGKAGQGLGEGAFNFLDKLNIQDIVKRFATEFEGAANTGLGSAEKAANAGIDVGARIGTHAADSFGKVGNEFISKGGELLFNSVKTYLPWIVFSLGATYAVPYAVKYAYQVAEKRLSRPKLASEVKYRGMMDWISDVAVSTVSNTYKVALPSIRAAFLTKSLLMSAFPITVGITAKLTNLVPDSLLNFARDLLQETGNLTRSGKGFDAFLLHPSSLSSDVLMVGNWWSNRIYLPKMQTVERIAFGVGALTAGWTAYQLFQKYASDKKAEPKAVFNEEITEVINDLTAATANIKKHKGYFQNLILHGPGGTGKTMIAKIIAKNSNMNYVMMSGGSLAQHIKNKDHVTELNTLMSKAKNSSHPTILFIDEAESFARNRDLLDSDHIELLNAFLNATGEPDKKLMLILATNRIEDIDEAVLSRMDHKVHIAPPEAPERKKILEQYIAKFFEPKERNAVFVAEKIQEMAEKTDGFTGRMIFKMLNVIAGKKVASKDNKLTSSMVDSTLDRFIRQEKEVLELRQPKKSMEAIRVSEPALTPMDLMARQVSSFGNRLFKAFREWNFPVFKFFQARVRKSS